MQFDEVSLAGFGRLTNATYSFQPGLNLIIGPNEAGKSTLLSAIFALLYGFFDTSSVTSARRELLESFKPWDTTANYRGSLTLTLHAGQRYRVERTFAPRAATALFLMPQQQDCSNKYRSDSHGRLYFADEMLGMSRTVFENTACLRQSELARLDKSASAITEAIVRLTTSGTADASAKVALDTLKAALRDEIGTPRAWTKPLATAQKGLEQLARTLEHETQRQAQLWSLSLEINQYEARLAHLKSQRERLTYLRLLAEQVELRASLAHIDEARKTVASHRQTVAQLSQYARVNVDVRDELQRQIGEWQRQSTQLAQHNTDAAELKARLVALQSQIDEKNRQLEASEYNISLLPATRDGIVALHSQWLHSVTERDQAGLSLAVAREQLSELQHQLEISRGHNQAALKMGRVGLAKLQMDFAQAQHNLDEAEQAYGRAVDAWGQVGMNEQEYQAYVARADLLRTSGAPATQQRGCNFFRRSAPVADQPTEVKVLEDIQPLHAALADNSRRLDEARTRYSDEESKIRTALWLEPAAPLDEEMFRATMDSLAALETLSTQLQLRTAYYTEACKKADELSEFSTSIADRLAQELLRQGIGSGGLAHDMDVYFRAFDKQASQAKRSAELEMLRQQQEQVATRLAEVEQLAAEVAVAEQRLNGLLIRAGVDPAAMDSIEKSLENYRLLCAGHERWRQATQELAASEQQLQLLQKVDQEQGTIHLIEVTDRELMQYRQSHPGWGELQPDQTRAAYERQLQDIGQEVQVAEYEAIRLRHQSSALESQSGNLAELYEQQMAAAALVEQLTHGNAIYSKAIELLQDATAEFQHAFAPRLEVQIAQGLNKVTSSRYQKARVNSADLALEILAPEPNGWVSAEQLSTGTRDLVYLVMRMAIADLLGSAREPLPLLLDDPFVHLDADREQQALAYLGQLAQENQVFFFSKDSSLPKKILNAIPDWKEVCLSLV